MKTLGPPSTGGHHSSHKGKLTYTVHKACAYRSDRPKWTLLAHNTETLHKLNNLCPGLGPHHKHKPWGLTKDGSSFSTAEETAYPMKLAFHIAYFLAQQIVLQGWNPLPVNLLCPMRCHINTSDPLPECSRNLASFLLWFLNLKISSTLMSLLHAFPQFCLVRSFSPLGWTSLPELAC